jgi:hypothetical protein
MPKTSPAIKEAIAAGLDPKLLYDYRCRLLYIVKEHYGENFCWGGRFCGRARLFILLPAASVKQTHTPSQRPTYLTPHPSPGEVYEQHLLSTLQVSTLAAVVDAALDEAGNELADWRLLEPSCRMRGLPWLVHRLKVGGGGWSVGCWGWIEEGEEGALQVLCCLRLVGDGWRRESSPSSSEPSPYPCVPPPPPPPAPPRLQHPGPDHRLQPVPRQPADAGGVHPRPQARAGGAAGAHQGEWARPFCRRRCLSPCFSSAACALCYQPTLPTPPSLPPPNYFIPTRTRPGTQPTPSPPLRKTLAPAPATAKPDWPAPSAPAAAARRPSWSSARARPPSRPRWRRWRTSRGRTRRCRRG